MSAASDSILATLIVDNRERIVDRFVERARAVGASKMLPEEEIIDSLREYLQELADRVREEWTSQRGPVGPQTVATSHGEQRFTHGYDLPALVREYGALEDLLSDVIEERGGVPFAEIRLLYKHLLLGIADSAGKYAALRDAELRRQTQEHIAFLAHEVRNPLSSATMAAGLIRARGEVTSSRAFDALERGLEKAAQLINDALLTVRLREAGALDRGPIEMSALLAEIAADSEEDAAAKGVSMNVEGDCVVVGDRKALASAISNLVRNAVKFSKANGDVHVHARRADGRIIIEVADSCGGLPEGAERKLFDPYVQVGKDRTGFGLGLAIAKQVADAHTGQLRVHNLPDKGCVFVLDLPAVPPDTSSSHLPESGVTSSHRPPP